ncbi:MAG: ABC transporter ATP-binding protein [Selenomonadaceae bacterium]|nr:ABC transporter ATP-binding protein [Selenomonadaceae bacterium]
MRLAAKNICFKIGEKKILDDVSVNFDENKKISIIGPNGAGKSTLLKILCLLNENFSGRVTLDGEDIKNFGRKKISQVIAILPQEKNAPNDTTVKQLANFGRFPHRKIFSDTSLEDEKAVEWALEVTKLKKFENRQVSSLSGGERQRAWLAMTLAQKPKILLLDEPTTYLDIAHQLEVMEIINSVNKNFGITVISVLHDINHARIYSDEIIVIKNGKIFSAGEPKKILTVSSVEKIFEVKADIFKNSSGIEMVIPMKCFS